MHLVDFILHVDKYLGAFVAQYGAWVYALLFLIVFVETGVVVMPFLPGDSLLFVVGAMCGAGLMSYPLAVAVLLVAGWAAAFTVGDVKRSGRCVRASPRFRWNWAIGAPPSPRFRSRWSRRWASAITCWRTTAMSRAMW